MASRGQHTLAGKEKDAYLRALDGSLEALARALAADTGEGQEALLRPFGERHDWAWHRLPRPGSAYATLATLVSRIRDTYSWLEWRVNPLDPTKNRGYFEDIEVSAESGLPWYFNLIDLHKVKGRADDELKRVPEYAALAQTLRSVLMDDDLPAEDVPEAARRVHSSAMRRSFLEQIREADLLGWEQSQQCFRPKATRLLALGGEELWDVSLMRYSPATSMFHAYIIDAWQDIREPQITPDAEGNGILSQKLLSQLHFSEDNAAWYILKTIDESFRSLHPVHVTRALIGPFECRHVTKPGDIPLLQITPQLLAENHGVCLLRGSRQYAYAPNHDVHGQELRQVVHREDWRDEYIVAPAAYASRVASSVLGERVKVVEA